ncbi:type II toxin-antitoxin system RelE/ParE family toxin [Variovorax sp. WS11]|uniref:type II toxin-antitoxin system RelE/ParE family toxin n=1 Tax=Variovorax sp. WS11 TaxID=1105204 RepID=UPI0035C07D3F
MRLKLDVLSPVGYKIDVGPGYRVYYSQRGTRLLLLLVGGDKSTQQKDIARAIHLARNFVE